MSDLSSMSDADLQAAYAQASAQPQDGGALASMSDDDLREAYKNAQIDQASQPVDEFGRGPEYESWLAQSSIGKVMDAFGQGVKQGWGADEVIHPDTAALLQKAGVLSDVKSGQTGIIRSFNDALLKLAAAGLDMALRAAGRVYQAGAAATSGALEAAVEAGTQVGGEKFGHGVGELGEFLLTDAGAHIPMHLVEPAPFALRSVADLDTARSLGVLGTEAEWKGVAPTEDFPAGTTTSYSVPPQATTEGETMQPYAPTLSPDIAQAAEPTNVHEAARQIAPDTFHEFDALSQDREALSNTIAAESEALRRNAEQQMPGADRIADYEARIQQMTPQMAAKYAGDLRGRISDIRDSWDQDQIAMLSRDTPEIAAMRQQLQLIDYRMRDLAPDVTAAYRSAAEQFPMQEDIVPAPVAEAERPGAEPTQEPAEPAATAEPLPPQSESAPQPAEELATEPTPQPAAPAVNIVEDVAQKLQAAGRPAEEAQAAGAVQEALWRTRAERFGGAKGTAEEMYAREAPEIRAGQQRASRRVPEMAQTTRGKIRLTEDGRAVITLFKDANASTFLHETGHDWLERMVRDAKDPDAAPHMARDADAVRKYLGNDGGELTTAQHEKFARSFERYFMEGRAPSSALARVFEQFKSWLTTIYQTVSRLRAPITDDIRDVFDRLLTTNPERQPVLALERERDLAGHVEPQTPFAQVPKEPTRLSAFVRKMGGIQEESGEIKDMLGGNYRNRPGLMNSTGMTHDLMAIEAMHAGYFPGYEEQHTLPPNILLERLREDLNGNPQYSMHDQDAVAAYHEALNRNAEVERLANKYGVDPTGLTHDQFFDKIAEAESVENLAESIRNTAEHAVEDFNDLDAGVRDTTEPPYYGITEPRSLEDLENEARQADAARYGEQGQNSVERPGHATGTEAVGEVGGGQVDGGAGAEGGGGAEVREGRAGSGNGEPGGPGGGEPVSGSGAAERPAPEPIDVKINPQDFRTKEDREIEKAANIRLDKLNTPDDMSAALRQLAEQNGDFMDARYGTAAYQQQMDIRNTRILLRAATSDMMAAASKAASMDPAAIADLLVKEQRAAMIFRRLSTLSADWAHAGHELNKVMEGWEAVKAITDQMNNDRDLFQRDVADRIKAYLNMPTAEQAGKFASDLELSRYERVRNGVLSYFINNLISGPITHMAYSIGNTVFGLYRAVPETLVSAASGALRGAEDRVYLGEAGAQIYGMMRGAADGITPAIKALKTGIPVLPGPQGDFGFVLSRTQSIPGRLGYVLETPSRAVTAIHTLFYTMSYSQEIARLAFRDASARGLVGNAFNDEVARLTSSPTSAMMEAADKAATRGVLMKRPEYGSAQYHLAQLVNNNAAAKLVMPFMQIGSNILEEGIVQRTPLAVLAPEARAELMGARGGAARDIRIGKIATGMMLATGTVGLAAGGLMTGGGPVDPDKRRVLEDSGWKAYSVRVGDLYIPYRKFLGPLGPLVASAADMYEIGHTLHDESLTKAAAALGFGFSEVVADETWMSGLSNFVEAVRNWDTKGEQYIRGLATSFIPFSVGMQQTARMVDPYQRMAHTMLEEARNKVPFASEGLEPRIGIWGQPIGSHTMVSPSAATHDPVDARLRALGFGVTNPGHDVVGVPLTEQQYTRYAVTAGRMAHERLLPLVTQPGFSDLPAGIQMKAIQQVINKSRETARALIKMESPSIIERATQRKIDLKANGRGGAAY